jgi:hypothetical protein
MEKSGFFNSSNGDRKYNAEFFAEYFSNFIGNGVFPNPSTGLQVTSNNDMTVTVKAGKGWINGYYYSNDSDLVLSIDLADGVLNRIDRIILQYNTVNRTITAKVKKGSLASSPVATDLDRNADVYELGIADVYIKAGSITISGSNITDLRLNSNYCGIVIGTIEQIDPTTIFDQYQSWLSEKKSQYGNDLAQWINSKQTEYEDWYNNTTTTEQTEIDNMETQFQSDFNTWFSGIKSTLDGDTAGNLYNLIDAVPKVYRGTIEPTGVKSIDFWFKEI